MVLYSSLDGFDYEPIEEWRLEKKDDDRLEIRLGTPVPAPYLKVHCKCDERDLAFIPVHNGEFINTLSDMIAVYYQVEQRIEQYQYDAAGNRKQETITMRSSATRDYSYYPNSTKLMTNGKYAFVYDDNGNLIQKGQHFTIEGDTDIFDPEGKDLWTYEYDLLNRLTKVEKDGKVVAEYLYDEAGLRLQKKGSDTTVYYVFDQNGQVLYEEENGEYLAYVYVLGKHFARVDGKVGSEEKQTYFYHTDHLGSTVLVTDEAGQAVWSTEYTPFGSLTIAEGKLKKAAKFTGKDLDEDTGLYYFNARWYDSEIGRFISEDPAADPNNPNLYTYCGNNPLVRIDPTGLRYYSEDTDYGQVIIKVTSVIKGNYEGGSQTIRYGMQGSQTIEYSSPTLSKTVTLDYVRWAEDRAEPGEDDPGYEYPAEPGVYKLSLDRYGKYPIKVEHTEDGIKLHLSVANISEGCPLLGDNEDIHNDIVNMLKSGRSLEIELEVIDERKEQEKATYPLPYDTNKKELEGKESGS